MSAAWAISFGLELAVYFGLGFMATPWAARRFGHALLFKIFGYIIGIGCPINAFVRVVRDYNRSLKKPHDGSDRHSQRPDDR